jgi:hypothetical protein
MVALSSTESALTSHVSALEWAVPAHSAALCASEASTSPTGEVCT